MPLMKPVFGPASVIQAISSVKGERNSGMTIRISQTGLSGMSVRATTTASPTPTMSESAVTRSASTIVCNSGSRYSGVA